MATVEVWPHELEDNTCWLGEAEELSTHIWQDVDHIASVAVCHCEGLDPPLGWLLWHILLCSKSAAEANHSFVYSDVSADIVARLKPCESLFKKEFTLSVFLAGVTYVQHPEDELEAVTGQNTTEERHRAHPRSSPVVFQFGKMDDAHVEDYC